MTLVQWLANGGAYGVLGLLWVGAGAFFANYAARLGRRYDAPNDGCLLGFATQVLVIIGGALGLLSLPFPWHVVTAGVGAIGLPWLLCIYFRYKMRAWRPR